VNFGVASLGNSAASRGLVPAEAARPSSCAPAIYDCGTHGWLTVAQIAVIAGTTKRAIYKRAHANFRGDELCQGRWANQSKIRKAAPPRRHMLILAFQLAERFPDRTPSPEEIMRLRPMSVANANHRRQAIATARAEVPARR
jgi:hypothetical protein